VALVSKEPLNQKPPSLGDGLEAWTVEAELPALAATVIGVYAPLPWSLSSGLQRHFWTVLHELLARRREERVVDGIAVREEIAAPRQRCPWSS
jgi:hypothetical protein